jgi:hypothetical protein
LIHSSAGPLLAIAPRQSFEDAVLGFDLYGDKEIHTNWPVRLSFPVFVLNVLEYLGGHSQAQAHQRAMQPGQQINLRLDTTATVVTVETPLPGKLRVQRGAGGGFNFTSTDALGVYRVTDGGQLDYRFAVNLFNPTESDIRPRANALKLGPVAVEATRQIETTRREVWKWILLAALFVLLGEWYIYNRRVYL